MTLCKDIAWSRDAHAAEWITRRLHPFARDVGSFVPEGFEAYARILHPAWRTDHGRRVKARWSEIARTHGGSLGASTRFDQLASGAAGPIEPPSVGTLDCDELGALLEVLAGATPEPVACWFGMWDGYGWMHGPPATAALAPSGGTALPIPLPPPPTARVRLPERPLALYRGPLGAAAAFCSEPLAQSPTLWWPADRGWCVASEVDFHSTYLGGAEELVGRVLREERLEALAIDPGASVTD